MLPHTHQQTNNDPSEMTELFDKLEESREALEDEKFKNDGLKRLISESAVKEPQDMMG